MKRNRILIDDSAYPVYVTTMVTEWAPVFGEPLIALGSLKIFEKLRGELNAHVNAYVLMPHHFHAIIRSQNKGDLSILMRKWKSLAARLIIDSLNRTNSRILTTFMNNAQIFNRQNAEKYQAWRPRFDDFAIRTPEQFKTKLNYIHENPGRSGLAERCEDYPYTSAHDYLGKRNGYVSVECVMAL